MSENYHNCIIVGAGPGGLSCAIHLLETGVKDVLILDRGQVGQSWLDYPPETRLLSESGKEKDENMIASIPVWEFIENVPHPSHTMYQKYLSEVAQQKKLQINEGTDVISVTYDSEKKLFSLTTNYQLLTTSYLVWATGMYATPNEQLACSGCFIHYSRIQDWKHIKEDNVTVIGGANGASEVVIQLAQPGRKVRLICSSPFEVPQPIDCLWKENRQLIKDLQNQGLVQVIENFRVKKIYHDDLEFIIESNETKILRSPTRPIVCIGFLPNIEPVRGLVDIKIDGHDQFLGIDASHQSTKTPHLFFAGTIGKLTHDDGFIRSFREFGKTIAQKIQTNEGALSTSASQ